MIRNQIAWINAAVLGCFAVIAATSHAAERVPVTKRILVFSRSQMKYGLDGHYLRRWVDRPLLIDPALRQPERKSVIGYPSYRRILDVVASYELDGLAFFPETSGRSDAFGLTDRAAVPGLALLPEFIAKDDLAGKRAVLQAALACRSSAKIDGKLLISSYRADSLKPEQWDRLLRALRGEFGPAFRFIPDISNPCGEGWAAWMARFDSDAGITTADRERLRQYLRSYARATDGLYMASAAAIKKDRRLHHRFYREFLAPLFRDVLAEPDMGGKIFGLSACGAHINGTRLGYTLGDDGTRTLRRSFEAAWQVRPDVIIIPEWDEQNENTSLRPTVDNSFSSRRIIRYYMQRIKGTGITPMPEDDTDVPNIVLSYRKLLTLGEQLRIELLNIPDSDTPKTYTAQVLLYGLDHSLVHRFPSRTCRAEELQEFTETLPSETLAAHSVLIPALHITRGGETRVFDRGWRPIQLRATWNWDYKWVKQPLRDMAQVPDCELTLKGAEDPRHVLLSGRVRCEEPLASVEIIEDGAVVYAADPRPHALRQLRDHVMLAFEYRAQRRRSIKGHVRVLGGACRWPAAYEKPTYSWYLKDGTLRLQRYVGPRQNVAYLAILKGDVSTASLDFEVGDLKRVVPVRDILERELITYHDGHDLTVTVSRFLKQNEHPPHLDRREATFSALVRPDLKTSLFHVRAITKAGRVYRSWPVRQKLPPSDRAVQLPVWSDAAQTRAVIRVAAERVPDIRYQLTERHGAALITDWGRPFWGILGGYTDSVTARGGGATNDGTPFIRASQFPTDCARNAPEWCTEDGRSSLRFNGAGAHIALPQGVLPRRGAFHLTLELKPLRDKPQILFVHRRHYIGSLTLRLDEGKLGGSFTTEQLKTYTFRTGLPVPAGTWSTVEISYDLAGMWFRVNGREAGPFECRGPGLYNMSSVVGGFGGGKAVDEFSGSTGWFEGFVAAISVSHRPRLPAP